MVPTCSAASTACPACKNQLQATDVSRTTDISNIELNRVAPIAANKWSIPSIPWLETFQISVTKWPPFEIKSIDIHRQLLLASVAATRASGSALLRVTRMWLLVTMTHCYSIISVCQVEKKDVVSENCLLRYHHKYMFPSSSSGKGPSYHFHVSLLWSLSIDALQRLGTTEQGSSKLSRLQGSQRFDPWY